MMAVVAMMTVMPVSMTPTTIMLLILELVLQLATQESTSDRT